MKSFISILIVEVTGSLLHARPITQKPLDEFLIYGNF